MQPSASQKEYFDRAYQKISKEQALTRKFTLEDIQKALFTPIELSGCIRGDRNYFAFNLIRLEKLAFAKVLDYGCGIGDAGLLFSFYGADSFGFDISKEACNIANLRRKTASLTFFPALMSADKLAYKPESFDFVFGVEILHHILNLPNVREELWRVLKPKGKAIFCEGLGMNPFINVYRRWKVKKMNIEKLEGNPSLCDYQIFGKIFRRIDIFPMHFTFMLKALFGWKIQNKIIIRLLIMLRQFDKVLLKAFPFLSPFCGEAVILLEK